MTRMPESTEGDRDQLVAALQCELASCRAELNDEKAQRTAMAEVLDIINSSPGDLAPVFETMLEKAARLCSAGFGSLWTYENGRFHAAAVHAVPAALADFVRESVPAADSASLVDIVRGQTVVHIADLAASELYRVGNPVRRAYVDLGGARTLLSVALRKDNVLLGAFNIYRQEVRPFSDKEIRLIENFAAQAVIAIENARLITETREALEQQTATAEVLGVINASPGDLAPVFDAMLEKAMHLCDAPISWLLSYQDEKLAFAAGRGLPCEFADYLTRLDQPRSAEGNANLVAGAPFVHMIDIKHDGTPFRAAAIDLGGVRTALLVALRKDGRLLGNFNLGRSDNRPFTDKQITLARNFAAQAVIAMENARLLTETREALEQQTATAEVLQVINASPGDLAPVFDTILEKAHSLCGAQYGSLNVYDGDLLRAVAARGLPQSFADRLRLGFRPGAGHPTRALENGTTFVQIPDLGEAADPVMRTAFEMTGMRTALFLPLLKEDRLLGHIVAARPEIRLYSEKQIALLQNFAAQAVIAMENARLINETREALEQQTATAEVLQVINSSPGDLPPVFDAMLEKALHLCGAAFGILLTYDGGHFQHAALRSIPAAYSEFMREHPPVYGSGTAPGQLALGEPLVHVIDMKDTASYRSGDPNRRAIVDLAGARTLVAVPLRKDDALLGAIVVFRQEARSFADKQIALLQNFAAQAVVAMENARLLGELRERTSDLQESLEYQTATSDVLKVISRSDAELEHVLENLVETATRLCQADHGYVFRKHEDGQHHLVAAFGITNEFREYLSVNPFVPDRGTLSGRVALERRMVHLQDAASDPDYTYTEGQQIGNLRTGLGVPLVREETLLGVIVLYRSRVERFTDKQIALAATFADQAVIAIENARLLGELRERTHDLEQSLEYQTATSDVLKVISRSTFDLQPVLNTLVETAAELCNAEGSNLFRREAEGFVRAASFGWRREFQPNRRLVLGEDRSSIVGRVALEGGVVHVHDLAADPEYGLAEVVSVSEVRTVLGVPLLREGVLIGAFTLGRLRVEPFTDRQIELIRTFADQAVIAIENTRLLTELRESLEQQQAIAEILQVINASPGDLQPVFDILLDKTMALCGAAFGALAVPEENAARNVTVRGATAFAEFRRRNLSPATPGSIVARWLSGEPVVHIADVKDDDLYRKGDPARRALVDLGGARSVLYVGLQKDGKVLGAISVFRQEVRPFSEKEIALLQSFAAQAVIAMDNARLLNEIRQRQAELRVTFDNMGDGVAMFDADLRLAAWNRNFQDILDLPEDFLAGRPKFPEYFNYLAARGEYGSADLEAQLRTGIDDTDREMRFERTRPDGRIVEVRRNAVPGGGFVMIYADVTERKRAEAEIRAARDAAEKALAELQTTQASLVHAQKMAALGQLTAGIAHEIKNPLNFVNNFAGLSVELLDELKEEAAPAIAALDKDKQDAIDETIEMITSNLEKIAEHGKRADGIVKSMLEHSRGGSGDWRPVDLNGLIEEALNLAYHGARAQDQSFNITMERDLDRKLAPIEIVPQDITRVFLNLFSNGFYAASKREREATHGFRPVLKVSTRDLGEEVEIRVRDNGTGIALEIRDKLFQPFVTTKPTGEGTGLGLSISYDIVTQQHGGSITVESEPDEHTEFTVRLPRHRHTAPPGRAA